MADKTLQALLDELSTLNLDENPVRFDEIVAELVNHAEALAAELPRLATSLSYQQRCAAAAVLARRKRSEDVDRLLQLLSDANVRVRRAAVRALTEWPRPEARARLQELGKDADHVVRTNVAQALGKQGVIEPLCGLLSDEIWNVRQAAAQALTPIADPSCLGPLAKCLGDDDSDVVNAAVAALVKLVPRVTPGDLDTALADLPAAARRKTQGYFAGDETRAPELQPLREALDRQSTAEVDPAELLPFGRILGGDDNARLGPCFERDRLLDDLLEHLKKPGNKSFVLVGEPGAGKTHVLHELARRAQAASPPWTILETSTSEIMVGTKYIGEWETKLRDLVGRIKTPRRVLLYLTDVNSIAQAGKTSNRDTSFMSLLSSYLRRGEVVIIGESTAKALQHGLEQEGAVRRLFQSVKVDPTDEATTFTVLRKTVAELSRRLKLELVVAQEVLDVISGLAETYYSGMVEPGRSVTLLKQVIEKRLEQGTRPLDGVLEISADDVVSGLARYTGLPERLLNDRRPLDPNEARAFFEERVLGQREAVDGMVDLITLVKAGLTDPGKPLGVFFFVGPTGVGKTEIAKTLAEFIFGSAERMIRVDLSEYKEWESHERLLGGTWRQEHGILTSKVREQPFSVILLDEFEKAHANVFDLFLQVFDDGRLTDGKGHTTDFRHTIIVMTSNIGSGIDTSGGMGFGGGDDGVPSEERVLKEVRRFFRPEFINRIGRIVVFKPLSGEVMRKIVGREIGKVMMRSGILRRGLLVEVDPAVVDLLLQEGFSVAYGARPLKRRVEQLVLLPLAREIVQMGPEDRGSMLRVYVDAGRIAIRRRRTHDEKREVEVAERLRLKRPDDERPLSVKPQDLPKLLERLSARVGKLTAIVEERRLDERKSTIVADTASPTFWDDAPRARKALAEMVHLESLLEGHAHARRKLDDLEGFAKTYQRHGASIKTRFEKAYGEFLTLLVHLEYKFLGEKDEDRRDVYLFVKRIGPDREATEALETIIKMYASWAERRGFGMTLVRTEKDEHGVHEQTYLLEGISLFGLLKGEDGLHRFEQGGKGPERRGLFVRVDVVPKADGERRIAKKDVKIDRGRGEVVAVHLPSSSSVSAGGDVTDEAVLDLLDARLADRERRQSGDADRIVRRYNIEGRTARDEATGVRIGHKELSNGGLDEILRARLFGTAPVAEAAEG